MTLVACNCCPIVWFDCKFFEFCISALFVPCVMLKWIFSLNVDCFLPQYCFYIETCSLDLMCSSLREHFCIAQSHLSLSRHYWFFFCISHNLSIVINKYHVVYKFSCSIFSVTFSVSIIWGSINFYEINIMG